MFRHHLASILKFWPQPQLRGQTFSLDLIRPRPPNTGLCLDLLALASSGIEAKVSASSGLHTKILASDSRTRGQTFGLGLITLANNYCLHGTAPAYLAESFYRAADDESRRPLRFTRTTGSDDSPPYSW